MPLDESFAPEPAAAAPVVAAPDAQPAPQPESQGQPEPQSPSPEPAAQPAAPAEPEPAQPQGEPAAPAPFDEAKYLQELYGDDAPKTAAEARERQQAMKAAQITEADRGRLAILSDGAKMAEFAKLQGTDYDGMKPVDVMRAKFAAEHPDMSERLLNREFLAHFSTKYPLMAQAIDAPDSVAEDDPGLADEMELAEYHAKAARQALKTTQQEKVSQFLQAAAAPEPLNAAQLADAKVLPGWLDEAMTDTTTLPIQAGDQTLQLPIGKSADFKADWLRSDKLFESASLNPDGTYNRANHALVTRFLQLGPQQFAQEIARLALAAQPKPAAAIPVATLAHSSAPPKVTAQSAAPALGGPRNQPAGVHADDWLNNNA